MRTDLAGKLIPVAVGARQQLAGARRRDDIGGAIAPQLRALGVEWHPEMQLLTAVNVDRGE